MKNRFNRCCCPGTEIEIFSADLSGQILFDYFLANRHQVQLGTAATIDGTNIGIWTASGALFGISNAQINRGAAIASATFTFRITAAILGAVSIKLYGDKAVHLTTPLVFNLNESNATTNQVPWSVDSEDWPAGVKITTPDISAVVQEIVNSPNWQSGQDLYLIARGISGTANINMSDSELTIEYGT